MRKFSIPVFILMFFHSALWAQSTTDIGVWLDHLTYSNVVDVHAVGDQIFVATEQGLFIYDQDEGSIDRLSKANGLSDVSLTTLGWSDEYKTLLVGFENGNVDLVVGSEVINVSDIRQSGNHVGLKNINHFEVNGNLAYICTDFGMVSYNLERNVFADNFIIGPNGSVLGIKDLSITPDSMYAATTDGLYVASLNDPLIFFKSWHKDHRIKAPIGQVENFNGRIMVTRQSAAPVNDSIFIKEPNGWRYVTELPDSSKVFDISAKGNRVAICNGSSAQTYDEQFKIIINVQTGVLVNEGISTIDASLLSLKSASIGESDDFLWIGSNDGMFANIRYDGANSYQQNIWPNSPAAKSVYKLHHDGNRLFVGPGGISDVYAPVFNNDGYYQLEDYFWTNYPNSEFNSFQDIVAFAVDPEDPKHFYASSYGNGIVEFQDNSFKQLISSLSFPAKFPGIDGGNEHRVGGFSTDEENNIWFTNSRTEKPLCVLRPDGTVECFSLGSVVPSNAEIKSILYTSQDQIWIQMRGGGVAVVNVVNETTFIPKKLSSSEGSGNLPSERVLSFAEDQDGEIWIGTDEGMAVLYSPQNIFEEERNYDAQIIVIDEDGDGNGERVLGSEQINDIEVDGSNKKWFATAVSGVFYTSENGKEQIFNFNKNNSPLPSNNVLDIEIDDVTGMVYFATDQGIVSFQGGATEGVESHTDVFAYPNPVYPDYNGPILIRGLVTNAQVKITDIEGNIVYETIAEGGQAIWSGRSFNGEKMQSGVYLAFITNDDGTATAVTKILIIK